MRSRLTMIRIDCLSQQVMCHDRIIRNFPTTGFDNRGGCRRGDSRHRRIRARASGESFAKASEVSGHAKGGAELRKLRAVRDPILLQNGGWNCCRARLVYGLCEEAGIKFNYVRYRHSSTFRFVHLMTRAIMPIVAEASCCEANARESSGRAFGSDPCVNWA